MADPIVGLVVFETTLSVWAAEALESSVTAIGTPLRLKVCRTRCRMVLSKSTCCWKVGTPP